MIYGVAPTQGSTNPLVYISICSLVGSVSVMAVKGFGVALKLTFAGNNQLWRPGTWVFAFTIVIAIAVQMNYFNKVSLGRNRVVSSKKNPELNSLLCRRSTSSRQRSFDGFDLRTKKER
jgi:hypothetical protein